MNKLRVFLQQEKLKELLLVTVAALFITGVRLLTTVPKFYGDPNWEVGYDHKVYLLMAESGISCNVPPAQPEPPFCWRIMTPLLAKTCRSILRQTSSVGLCRRMVNRGSDSQDGQGVQLLKGARPTNLVHCQPGWKQSLRLALLTVFGPVLWSGGG